MSKDKLANLGWALIRPIATVFASQIDGWLDEVAQRAGSRLRGKERGLEGASPIDQIIEEEIDRIDQKIGVGKYRYIALVEGEFGFDRRNCRIIPTRGFLDELYSDLRGRLYREEAIGEWSEEGGGLGRGPKEPSLEEALTHPIPLVTDENIYKWVEKVAQEVAEKVLSKTGPREKLYDPEVSLHGAVEREVEKAIDHINQKLKEIGSQYINIFEGSLDYFDLRGNCQLAPVRDFIGDLYVVVTDRAIEILEGGF